MWRKVYILTAGALIAGAFCGLFQGCAATEDFVTLFNIYYNAKRIMNEVEEPPDDNAPAPGNAMLQNPLAGSVRSSVPAKNEIPEYYEELIRKPNFDAAQKVISRTIVQRANAGDVDKKLDSVVLKCTKILKFHSTSSYVPDALFLIAKAYYYKGKQTDFLYSKQKCDEFIQTFPDNELYVDAHLLLAEDYVALKDDEEARRALSRCVDIALPRKRYDAVSTALELTADLAMKHGDLEGAIDPYLHAMLLSDNDEANTGWQLRVATLFLETQHYYDAIRAFKDVFKYDPDDFPAFEARYGLGAAYREAHYFDSSASVFNDLLDKSKYSDWKGYVEFELATLQWAKGNKDNAADEYKRIDTVYRGTELSSRANYEYAMRLMQDQDYSTARGRFEKVKQMFVPYAKDADNYYTILSVGGEDSKDVFQLQSRLKTLNNNISSGKQGGHPDSASLQDTAIKKSPPSNRAPIIGGAPVPMPQITNPAPHATIAGKDSTSAPAQSATPSIAGLGDSAAAARKDSLAAATRVGDSLKAAAWLQQQRALRDTTANQLARKLYDLGRMYYLLGKPDTMLSYYRWALNVAASGDIIPKTLYSYALYYQDKGVYPDTVDSLMQIIAGKYPLSQYAELARLHLGLTEESKIDSAETEYMSGESYMRINQDSTAEQKYWNIYKMFPRSDYAPQALYAIGWMFENKHSQYDSAKYYYAILIKQYPNSEYARNVQHLFVAMADTAKGKGRPQGNPPAKNNSDNLTPQQRMEQEMMRRRMMQSQPGQEPGHPAFERMVVDTSALHHSADTSNHVTPATDTSARRQPGNGALPQPNGQQPPGFPEQRKHP